MICASSWLQSWYDDTSNSLLESTTSDSVQRRRFVHPCQSWPAVYRLMRRAPFIQYIGRYDSQSFLRIGGLQSPCGSSRIPTSNPCRCCVHAFKFCSGSMSKTTSAWPSSELLKKYIMYKGTCDQKMLMFWLAEPYGWWQPCQLPELLHCFYCYIDVAFWHTYTHKNSNVIPALSEF